MLEDSLGGNCKTTIMAMISPSNDAFGESVINNNSKIFSNINNNNLFISYLHWNSQTEPKILKIFL